MIELEKIPLIVWEELKKKNVLRENVLVTALADRSEKATPCDNWLIFTGEKLILQSGVNQLLPKSKLSVKGAHHKSRAPFDVLYKELSYEEFIVGELEDFKVEALISGCILTATRKKENKSIIITYLTCNKKDELENLCICINEYIKDGKIEFTLPEKQEIYCPKCGDRYPDPQRKICPRCLDRAGVFKRLMQFTIKYKVGITFSFIAMLCTSALSILAPYLSSGFFFDKVLTEGSPLYGQVLFVICIIVATKILSLLANMVNEIVAANITPKIVYDLKKVIFKSIEKLSLSFFTSRQTGSLMTQVNNDADNIYWFFTNGVPSIIINIIQTVAIIIIMLLVNWRLTIFALACCPIAACLVRVVYLKMNKVHSKAYTKTRSLGGLLSDILNGIRVVKAFAREKEENKRFNRKNEELAQAETDVSVKNSTLFPFLNFLYSISSVLVLGFGGWMVIRGQLSYGMLITFIAYTSMLYSPLMFFMEMINWVSECSTAMQRLMEVMDAQPEVREVPNPISISELSGNIEFKNVEFSYEKNTKIIDDISFSIKSGETIGIVGHTGAGKSTIANLLIRLYDVDRGSIIIDGINVKDLSFDTLRNNIAIVSQETYMFQGTIYDNICYAKPEATKDEIVRAARISGAHEFICKLPDAYSTRVGWGYKELSGGERQRISIARAILRDPSILILDEATSAMDTRTERSIQNALEILSEGKTTIMIAHRLSTLRSADKLIVIENGKIPEAGTHDSLIREKGIYYKLYMLQYEALKNAGIEE